MPRGLALLALVVCLCAPSCARDGASVEANTPASAPATRPAEASAKSPEPTSAHAPGAARAETLRKARQVAEISRQLIKLAKAGKFAECKPLLDKILAIDPHNSIAWYNMACVHSRLGAPAKAVQALNKALAAGYSDFRYMQRDPDLDGLRKRPDYKRILARNDQIQRDRAEKMRKALQQRFGSDYICQVDHGRKLVFATNVDRTTLAELKTVLTAHAEALWKDLFDHRFEQYVTIVIPSAGDAAFRRAGVGGYYAHIQRMLMARQIGMVLTHEFTHALHDADQDGLGQRHPIWIMEGLATLYESSKIVDGRAVPQPNRRLNMLQRYVAASRTLAFKTLFKCDQAEFMKHSVTAYPQVRYIMMYLHAKGRLKKWYDAYTAGYDADPTGGQAIAQVFGKDLGKVEADWKRWVKAQTAPPVRLPVHHAYMGVSVRGQTDGLRIARIVKNSGAHKAGLKPGDVIVKIDAERMVDAGALIRLVSAKKVGDRLKVRFRRGGEYKTVTVTLGAMPAHVAGVRPTPRTRPKPRTAPATQPATAPAPASGPATQPAKKAA